MGKHACARAFLAGSPNSMSLSTPKEGIEMNAGILERSRRWLVMVTLAVGLALATGYGPVVLDAVGGASLVTTAYACQPSGNGCG